MSADDNDEASDQPVETVKDGETNEPVNKRDSQCVSGDDDDQNENDENPQKKPRRQESDTAEEGEEEEEDAVIKARKVLEMFQKEFGEDDDLKDKPESKTTDSEKSGLKDKAGVPVGPRFQRKPIILQDDDPCLL